MRLKRLRWGGERVARRRESGPLDREKHSTEGQRSAPPAVNRREEVLAPSVA